MELATETKTPYYRVKMVIFQSWAFNTQRPLWGKPLLILYHEHKMQYILYYLVIKGKSVDKLLQALLLPPVTFHFMIS